EFRRVEAARQVAAARSVTFPWRGARWRHLDAPVLAASAAGRDGLAEQDRVFGGLLRNRHRVGVARLFDVKGFRVTAGHPEDVRHIAPILGLERWLDDPEVELRPVPLDRCRLEIAGNGRVARLVDERGRAPIVIARRDGMFANYIEAWFSRGSAGWVLV